MKQDVILKAARSRGRLSVAIKKRCGMVSVAATLTVREAAKQAGVSSSAMWRAIAGKPLTLENQIAIEEWLKKGAK